MIKINIPTRFCECGSRMNAGAHGHAEGCGRNMRRYWLRLRPVRIKVRDEHRWTISKLVMGGICFYSGIALNVGNDFDTAGYFIGAGMMIGGLAFLWRCCR